MPSFKVDSPRLESTGSAPNVFWLQRAGRIIETD
jgi:hypothetical protein